MVTGTNPLTAQILPQSLEAERAVLGALLLEPDAWPQVHARLSPDDFYKEGHRTIFAAMVRLVAAGYGVDLVTLSEALRQEGVLDEIGGPAYLSTLLEEAALLVRVDDYASIVLEKARLRDLIRFSTETIARAFENGQPAFELLMRAANELENLTRRAAPAAPEPELRRAGFDPASPWNSARFATAAAMAFAASLWSTTGPVASRGAPAPSPIRPPASRSAKSSRWRQLGRIGASVSNRPRGTSPRPPAQGSHS